MAEPADEGQDLELVADVEVVRGLVQQEQGAALRGARALNAGCFSPPDNHAALLGDDGHPPGHLARGKVGEVVTVDADQASVERRPSSQRKNGTPTSAVDDRQRQLDPCLQRAGSKIDKQEERCPEQRGHEKHAAVIGPTSVLATCDTISPTKAIASVRGTSTPTRHGGDAEQLDPEPEHIDPERGRGLLAGDQ